MSTFTEVVLCGKTTHTVQTEEHFPLFPISEHNIKLEVRGRDFFLDTVFISITKGSGLNEQAEQKYMSSRCWLIFN